MIKENEEIENLEKSKNEHNELIRETKNNLESFKELVLKEKEEIQNIVKISTDKINEINIKLENLSKINNNDSFTYEEIKNKLLSKFKENNINDNINNLKDINELILENKNNINVLSSNLEESMKNNNEKSTEINKIIEEIKEKISLLNSDLEKHLKNTEKKLTELNNQILSDKNDRETEFKSIWDTISLIFQNNNNMNDTS